MSRSAARIVALGALVALWGSGTSGAQTAAPTVGVLVDQIQALFPKVDGEVIEVQSGTVTLALGSKDGLVAGVELALYRPGRELKHPKTGEVLGRTEQQIGRLVIQQVFEAYSTGTASSGSEVQPGDRARISAGKIKLSVVPLLEPGVKEALADAAVHEIIDGLNRTGRFQIGLGDAIGVWINQQGAKREDVLAGKGLDPIAERFKVDNLLVVAFSRVQAKPYMDVRLFSFPGTNSRLNTALFVPATIKPPAKGDYSASGQKKDNQTPNQQRSFLARLLYGELDAGTYSSGEQAIPLREVAKFPFVIASMDLAIGSKDRIARLAITDGATVWLYRLTPERVLDPEWTYKVDSRAKIFNIQLAELSNDSTLHVVINRYSAIKAIRVNSLILATKDQKPVVAVDDVPDILIAVDTNGDGVKKTLWSQSFAETGFFKQGDATRMTLRNGEARCRDADRARRSDVRLPPGADADLRGPGRRRHRRDRGAAEPDPGAAGGGLQRARRLPVPDGQFRLRGHGAGARRRAGRRRASIAGRRGGPLHELPGDRGRDADHHDDLGVTAARVRPSA